MIISINLTKNMATAPTTSEPATIFSLTTDSILLPPTNVLTATTRLTTGI